MFGRNRENLKNKLQIDEEIFWYNSIFDIWAYYTAITKFICEKNIHCFNFSKFILKEEMIKLTFCSIMLIRGFDRSWKKNLFLAPTLSFFFSIRLKRRKAKEIKSNSKHQAFDKFNIVARLCYVYIYGNDIRVSRVNNIYMEGNYVLGYGLVFSIQIESFHSRESVRAAYIVSSPISFFINFNTIKNRYNETKISLQLRFR